MADDETIPFVRPMIAASRAVGVALVVLLLLAIVEAGQPVAYGLVLGAMGVLACVTWGCMLLAGLREIGAGYAIWQVVLSLLLTPVLLVGLLVVPCWWART